MKNKEYCVYKDVKCNECSLVSYGRDCQNNPIRSEAQKAADMRYAKKVRHKYANVQFKMSAQEALEVEKVISESGLTNVGFLRKAVEAYKQGKFDK